MSDVKPSVVRSRGRVIVRRVSQVCFLLLFLFLLGRTKYSLPAGYPVDVFFRTDGFLALVTTVSTLVFSVKAVPALVLAALLVWRGNFFCSGVCPMGSCGDFCRALLFRRRWPLHLRVRAAVYRTRYILLASIVLTAAAALLVGVPFWGWFLDPFVILTRGLVVGGGWLIFAIGVVAVNVFLPRFWCNAVCPLGAWNHLLGVILRRRMFGCLSRGKNTNEQARVS